ncbi:hypothetical protein QR680_000368 [Steinernema hermaphroditum]|uniref:Enoyl-[acyl-carrier-protein] reductase, mitochondrial n=1 Tax=Steinernema hermaphroditum TaxID=289476 RepID=A0AA39LE58_9BILA|nr:hypothetical protein QR680_000368 [Steinernema hermaphroditum]
MKLVSNCIRYSMHGDPRKVLTLNTIAIDADIKPNEILVKWLASPINPLDINKIEGKYPLRPDYPATGGSEAVGIVENVGADIRSLHKGDHVISNSIYNSVWTQYDVLSEDAVLKVRSDLDVASASTLLINPPTAYIMLTEYVKLSPGDFVVQNSANSAVGRCVIQIASALGLKTINIVRDRPDIDALKKGLMSLGGDYVFTEEEFTKNNTKFIKTLPAPPRLALNGVGGRSAMVLCASLGHGGTVVTYGAMSKKPIEILSSSFIFKDLRAFGVAVGPWMQMHPEKAGHIMTVLQDMLVKGQLSPPPMEQVPMAQFATAMEKTLAGRNKKQLVLFHDDVSKEQCYKSKL